MKQTHQNVGPEGPNTAGLAMLVMVVHAMPLLCFFRVPGTAGRRFIDLTAVASVFYVAIFSAVTIKTGLDATVMKWFEIAFLASAVFHAVVGGWRRLKALVHSGYLGDSGLGVLCPWLARRKGDLWLKKYAEPTLTLLLALATLPWCPPLGAYLFFGTFALTGLTGQIEWRERLVTQAMFDAVDEQRRAHQNVRHHL